MPNYAPKKCHTTSSTLFRVYSPLCSCLMSPLPGEDWSNHHLKYYQSSTFGKYPIFKMTWTTDLTINKSAIGLTIIGKRPININSLHPKAKEFKCPLSWKCPLTKYFFCELLSSNLTSSNHLPSGRARRALYDSCNMLTLVIFQIKFTCFQYHNVQLQVTGTV